MDLDTTNWERLLMRGSVLLLSSQHHDSIGSVLVMEPSACDAFADRASSLHFEPLFRATRMKLMKTGQGHDDISSMIRHETDAARIMNQIMIRVNSPSR
mmetsp:Transcript_18220/g.38020  ORF Transcript_18220/g.38020 Transcript_18220/m.38020 type:complete len:99 (+) Transcript_18220:165-461(+)